MKVDSEMEMWYVETQMHQLRLPCCTTAKPTSVNEESCLEENLQELSFK